MKALKFIIFVSLVMGLGCIPFGYKAPVVTYDLPSSFGEYVEDSAETPADALDPSISITSMTIDYTVSCAALTGSQTAMIDIYVSLDSPDTNVPATITPGSDIKILSSSLSGASNTETGTISSDDYPILLDVVKQASWTVGGVNDGPGLIHLEMEITVNGLYNMCAGASGASGLFAR